MTKEQAKERLPIIEAYANGAKIQYRNYHGQWCNNYELGFEGNYPYRIKPEPSLREWKSENVPVGALFRWKNQPYDRNIITAAMVGKGIDSFYHGAAWKAGYKEALELGEYSIDNGKTWLPCGILDPQE